MLNKFFKKKSDALDNEIEFVIDSLKGKRAGEEDYERTVSVLERLEKIRGSRDQKLTKDAKAMIAANILGISLILGYEKVGVITTKALGFVNKGRV